MKLTIAQRRQLGAIERQLSQLEQSVDRAFDALHEADDTREDIRLRLHQLMDTLPSDFSAVAS